MRCGVAILAAAVVAVLYDKAAVGVLTAALNSRVVGNIARQPLPRPERPLTNFCLSCMQLTQSGSTSGSGNHRI